MAEVATKERHREGKLLLKQKDGKNFSSWATVTLWDDVAGSGFILEFRNPMSEKMIDNELRLQSLSVALDQCTKVVRAVENFWLTIVQLLCTEKTES